MLIVFVKTQEPNSLTDLCYPTTPIRRLTLTTKSTKAYHKASPIYYITSGIYIDLSFSLIGRKPGNVTTNLAKSQDLLDGKAPTKQESPQNVLLWNIAT